MGGRSLSMWSRSSYDTERRPLSLRSGLILFGVTRCEMVELGMLTLEVLMLSSGESESEAGKSGICTSSPSEIISLFCCITYYSFLYE